MPDAPVKALVEPLEPRRLLCTVHTNPGFSALSGGDAAGISPAATTTSLAWSSSQSRRIPLGREEGAGASLNGKLYVFGGFFNSSFDATTRVDVFDPAAGKWARLPDMPFAVTHAATFTTSTKIWLVGGYIGRDPGPSTAAILIFNTRTNKWGRGPDMPAPRGASAAALVGNTAYIFGGRNKSRTAEVKDSIALNIDTNEWRTIARMPDPRNHLSGAQVDGQVYSIGGQKNEARDSVNLDVTYRYNPKKNRWFPAPDLPGVQSHTVSSTLVYDKKILVVGGERQHNVAVANTLVFDPYANKWSKITSLPSARRAPQAGIINDRIYVAGGSINGAHQDDLYVSNNISSVL